MNQESRVKKYKSGFALFVALIITGALLLIATGIVNLALKQSAISRSGRESQEAFYAADTGMECALYWDIGSPSGVSAFLHETGVSIYCNKDSNNPTNQWVVGGSRVSTINRIDFAPDPYCAIVTVTKDPDGSTTIESKGYNNCEANSRRVERAVRASY